MTTLVIDMPTDRVIWFTNGNASDVVAPDDRAALYEYEKSLPEGMTVNNSFKYKLVKGELVLADKPAPSAMTILESNQKSAVKEVSRWFAQATAGCASSTQAGNMLRQMKLAQAKALIAGEETAVDLLNAVATQQGNMTVQQAAEFVVSASESQIAKLSVFEQRRTEALSKIAAATTSEDVAKALSDCKAPL